MSGDLYQPVYEDVNGNATVDNNLTVSGTAYASEFKKLDGTSIGGAPETNFTDIFVENDLFSDKLKTFSNEIIYQGNKLITNNDLIVETKTLASDKSSNSRFGYSVAMSGNYAIIGMPYDGNYLGAAYIFERDSNGNWGETQKLVAEPRVNYDYFGWSVAMSGNYAIVGVYGDTSQQGSAYIFERDSNGNWGQTKKLSASDKASGDRFGWSVAMSGNYAIVGANKNDDTVSNSGSAYIFQRDTDGNWGETQKLLPSDGANLENDHLVGL